MCGVVCDKLVDSSLGDREYISITQLIIIKNRKYLPFPLFLYFSVVVCPGWLDHHMLSASYIYISRESWLVFLLLMCSIMTCANGRVHYSPMVLFVCSHIALISLASLCRCIWRYWISKIKISKIKSNLSIIFHELYGAVCIRFTHFSWVDCGIKYTLY